MILRESIACVISDVRFDFINMLAGPYPLLIETIDSIPFRFKTILVGILKLLLSQILVGWLVSCQSRVIFSACVVQRPFQDRQARMLLD